MPSVVYKERWNVKESYKTDRRKDQEEIGDRKTFWRRERNGLNKILGRERTDVNIRIK